VLWLALWVFKNATDRQVARWFGGDLTLQSCTFGTCRSLLPHQLRIHLANRCHDVVGVGFRIFRVEGDTGAAVEDSEGARAAGRAVADSFAALRLERGPGGVDGALVLDVGLRGQDDG